MAYYMGLTNAQYNALCQIAFGFSSPYNTSPKTLQILIDKGLIVKLGQKPIYGKGNTAIDRIPVMIDVYEMPISEHYKFCVWCSENASEADEIE